MFPTLLERYTCRRTPIASLPRAEATTPPRLSPSSNLGFPWNRFPSLAPPNIYSKCFGNQWKWLFRKASRWSPKAKEQSPWLQIRTEVQEEYPGHLHLACFWHADHCPLRVRLAGRQFVQRRRMGPILEIAEFFFSWSPQGQYSVICDCPTRLPFKTKHSYMFAIICPGGLLHKWYYILYISRIFIGLSSVAIQSEIIEWFYQFWFGSLEWRKCGWAVAFFRTTFESASWIELQNLYNVILFGIWKGKHNFEV